MGITSPLRDDFLNLFASRINNAWLRDPWGHPYFVLCDHDYDGEITDPCDSTKIGRAHV